VSRRVVAPEMGQQLAQRLGCRYVETSAKDSARVDEAFNYIVDECVAKRPAPLSKDKKGLVRVAAAAHGAGPRDGGCQC
jgi:hypothetical protein